MPVVPGAFTKDGVPVSKLYTAMKDDIGMHKEDMADWVGKFCGEPTTDTTVEVAFNSMEMRPIGNSSRPYHQHVDTYTLSLSEPMRYGVAPAVDAGAWENGISSHRLRQHVTEGLKADRKLCIRTIVDAIFKTYGWYNQWMTPPEFASNAFLSTHDHYLAYNVSGLLSVNIASIAKRHIGEHGYDTNQIVGFVNGDQAAKLEQSADITDSAIMESPLIQDLQRYGFTPAFPLAGVPHVANDWIPSNYAAYLTFEETLMGWRVNADEQRNLIVYDQETVPNAAMHWFGEFVRWVPSGGPTVIAPGAGVVVRLNNASYAAPTALVSAAA